MLFRVTAAAAALLLAAHSYAANVITITQYPSVCSAVYTTGSRSFIVVQSTITVQPVPYNDTAYNTAETPFVIETTPEGSTVRSWLTYDGTTTTNATLAGQYVIRNGGLYTITGGQISANAGAGVQSFAPSATVGSISTGFAYTNGVLSWTNPAFPSGSIGFYSNGQNLIFSTNGNVPPGYYKVVVRAVSKSLIDGVATAGVMSVSTSIVVGTMSGSPPLPPGYSSPGYQGPISSSAPPFVYMPTTVASSPPASVATSVGQPPAYASSSAAKPSSSSAAVAPPPGYSSPPAVASVSAPPAPIISPSVSPAASSSPAASPPAASPSPRPSSSVAPVNPPAYSSPAASASASSSAGPNLSTQTYLNTPIGPNNPIISTAVSSSAAMSSSASTSTLTVLSVSVPSLPSEPPYYVPTPVFSSPVVSSSSMMAGPSISIPVYSSPVVPIGPNNPSFAATSSSSSASSSSVFVASSSGPYSLPDQYVTFTPSSSLVLVLPTTSSVAVPPVVLPLPSLSSSSAAVLPPVYSPPAGVSTSSSSSAPVPPPVYSPPSSAAASSSSSSAHSSSSSAPGLPPAYPVTTTTSSASSSSAVNSAFASTVPSCPTGDGTTFYDANGAVYTLFCSVEGTAVSYSTSPARGLQACMSLCDADAQCVAATYAGAANDGTCYLKATLASTVSSPVQYLVKRSGPTNGIGAASSVSSSAGAPPAYGGATTTTSSTMVSSSSSPAAGLPTSTTVTTTTTSTTSTTRTTTTSTTTTSTTRTTTTTTSTSASPYLILPSPTSCDFGDPTGYPEDDSYCEIDLPFPVSVYGASSKNTFASTNGYISILAGSSQYQVSQFPVTALPNNTIAPYFDDLYLYDNSYPQQGIWYQIQGTAVVWEYYLGRAGNKGSVYHFTVAYDSAVPGSFRFKYYSVGTDSADKGTNGLYAGVGMQGLTASSSQYKQYSYQEAGSIKPGMTITCSTSANTCTAGGTSLINVSIG